MDKDIVFGCMLELGIITQLVDGGKGRGQGTIWERQL